MLIVIVADFAYISDDSGELNNLNYVLMSITYLIPKIAKTPPTTEDFIFVNVQFSIVKSLY